MYEEKLREIIKQNPYILEDLKLVKSLGLTNEYIAAGYVRNLVWDILHGYEDRTPLDDVDIVYFDPKDRKEGTEKNLEQVLKSHSNRYKWSVKNQARMHLLKDDAPYSSVEDAMKRWPETATAVGIKLNEQDEIEILAPHDLDDLFELKLRKSVYFNDNDFFKKRIEDKKWLTKWPLIKVVSS